MTTEYKRQISFGNLIQIGVTLVTVTLAYAAVNGAAAANREDIGKVSRTQDAMEARLRTLENSQARSDERFSSILTYLSRIDNRLERIEQGGQK